jgi:signal peptidase I
MLIVGCNSGLIGKFKMFLMAGMIVTSALIIWKGLMVATGSESPVVVVLSGSMEPGFKRVCYLLTLLHNTRITLNPYAYLIIRCLRCVWIPSNATCSFQDRQEIGTKIFSNRRG